mgnify:CR=1 FL=1
MNNDKYGLNLKLEKACRANREMEFLWNFILSLCKQFLKRYRGSKILKTAWGKTVIELYILCKISIRSQEQCLAYRSNFLRRSIFYKALSIYANEGENVNKYPPIHVPSGMFCIQKIQCVYFKPQTQYLNCKLIIHNIKLKLIELTFKLYSKFQIFLFSKNKHQNHLSKDKIQRVIFS